MGECKEYCETWMLLEKQDETNKRAELYRHIAGVIVGYMS